MSNIKLFQTQQVRTHWDEKDQKWYFAIIDVIEILTESIKPRDYGYRLKKRERGNGVEPVSYTHLTLPTILLV